MSKKDFRIYNNILKKYVGNESDVTLPEEVKAIGEDAFDGCKSIKNITLPAGLKEIGRWAFRGCESLENIDLPDSVTTIGESAFSGCKSIKNITLPTGLKEIGRWAFGGCESLESISIPNGVTSIECGGFKTCKKLKRVTIPGSVTSIGDGAFEGCSNLESVVILNGVAKIGDNAFKGLEKLININIPESISYIGKAAFCGCKNLVTTIPTGIEFLGEDFLLGCDMIEDRMVYDIKNGVLINCYGKCDEAIVPEAVNKIKKGAFNGCMAKSVVLPETVQTIEHGAFSYNNVFIQRVTLCKTLEKEVFSLFDINDNLQELIVDENSSKMKSVDGVLYSKDMKTLIFYPRGKRDKEFTVPSIVQNIGNAAFKGAHFLEKLNLSDNLTRISADAFKGLLVKYIVIPKSVNKMASKAIKCMWSDDAPAYYSKDFYKRYYTPWVIIYRKELIDSIGMRAKIAYVGKVEDIPANRRHESAEGFIFALNHEIHYFDKFRDNYIKFIANNKSTWVKGFCKDIKERHYLIDNDLDNLRFMLNEHIISQTDVNKIIDLINNVDEEYQSGLFEIKAELMEYCNVIDGGKNDEFDLTENENQIKKMAKIIERRNQIKNQKGIKGISFACSGELPQFDVFQDPYTGKIDKSAIQSYIEMHGGLFKNSVSSKVDYLISNNPDSGSDKCEKARELGIPIINENEFIKLAEDKGL